MIKLLNVCSSLLTAIGVDAQVGVFIKGFGKSVGVFGLTAAVGADDTAVDETVDVDDTVVVSDVAVVPNVAVVPDDVTVDVDSAVEVVIWNADSLCSWNSLRLRYKCNMKYLYYKSV